MQPTPNPGADLRATEFAAVTGTYLNAASYGPLPARTVGAVQAFDERRAAALLEPHDFAGTLARARAAAATLLGVSADSVALTPNTSVGLNIGAHLAAARATDARRTVILPDREFPANVYPWLALERRGDIDVQIVPPDAGGLPDERALLARVAEGDVVALAISAVQFASGYRADLDALGDACARHDVLFVVDGIQALGAVPVDPVAARIGVLATGAQKWLCSPFGTGFAWIDPALRAAHEPALPGWLSFASTADYAQLLSYEYDLWDDARRFEVGSLANQGFAGMAQSVELIAGVGVTRIHAHVHALLDRLHEGCAALDVTPVVSRREHASCISALTVRDPARVYETLTAAGVTCAAREGAIRISPHFYSTDDDIDHVVDVLRQALRHA